MTSMPGAILAGVSRPEGRGAGGHGCDNGTFGMSLVVVLVAIF